MRSAAVETVRRGFRAFPCIPGTKLPAVKNWANNCFVDMLETAEQWPGDAHNIGVHCRGLVVVDVDVKNGRDGIADLKHLPDMPETYTVKTPSGGLHLYYRLPPGVEVSNSARNLPAGIDVRGAGGYVLAPGSIVDGKPYVIARDLPVAPAPEWLLERLRTAAERTTESGTVIGELDTPVAIDQARKVVARQSDSFEGSRDDDGARLANRLADFGISQETCLQLLLAWNDTKVHPPLDDADIERLSSVPWRSRQSPIGRDNPLHGLEPVPPPEKGPNPFGARCVDLGLSDADEAAIPPRPWLVNGLLLRGQASELIAPGGSGKSTFSLNVAAAVALGNSDLIGMEVTERARVLIVNAEDDIDEQNRRTAAMRRHFNIPHGELNGRVMTYNARGVGYKPFIVAERDAQKRPTVSADVEALIEFARAERFGLIVVDPLVKTHRLNENDNGEMDFVGGVYSRIAHETGAAILLLHHTKKPPQASASGYEGDVNAGRGASAIKDAVRIARTMFQMTEKEAQRLGVPERERRAYSRLDDAKGNYSALRSDARWFHLNSVTLANGDDAPAMAPHKFDVAEADETRRAEIVRRIAAAEADGKALAATTRGNHGGDAVLAKALGVTRDEIKRDLDVLKSRGDIRTFIDPKGKDRLAVTDEGNAWSSA